MVVVLLDAYDAIQLALQVLVYVLYQLCIPLGNGFRGYGAGFRPFDVQQKIIDLGNAFVFLPPMGPSLAQHIPVIPIS